MHRDTIIASRGNTAGGKGYQSGAALIDKHVIIIIVHGKLFSMAVVLLRQIFMRGALTRGALHAIIAWLIDHVNDYKN